MVIYWCWSCAGLRRRAQDWRIHRRGPKAAKDLTGVRRKHCRFWKGQLWRVCDGNRCHKLPRRYRRMRMEVGQGTCAGGGLLSRSGTRLLADAFGRRLGRGQGCKWRTAHLRCRPFLYERLSLCLCKTGCAVTIAEMLPELLARWPVLAAVACATAETSFGSSVGVVMTFRTHTIVGGSCLSARPATCGGLIAQRAVAFGGHPRFCWLDCGRGRQAL